LDAGFAPYLVRIARLSTHLLAMSGAARDYSLSEMTSSLTWLYFVDPEWVRQQLIPRFDPASSDAEPAWSGYQYDQNQANSSLFALLKPYFLSVFVWLSRWRWEDAALRHFTELLVLYCFWHQSDGRYITYAEVRITLQQTTDAGRTHAAWMLTRIVKNQHVWPTFGRPFIENAWPRERRFQTSATSRQLADLARAADDGFPDAVRAVLPVLVPVEHVDMILHDVTDDSVNEGASAKLHQRFPEAFLALLDRLIDHDAHSCPYGLGNALHAIAEAAPPLRQDARWRLLSEIASRE
jgi:hypothetical protein